MSGYQPFPVDGWHDLPEGVTGTVVRCRKVFGPPMTTEPTRLGGDEVYVILAETDAYVIYGAWSREGEKIREDCLRRERFEEVFERKPSPTA